KTRRNSVLWTPDEIEFLKASHAKLLPTQIAVRLGRTLGALRTMAHRLGLELQKPDPKTAVSIESPPRNGRSRWTITELNYVEAHYGKTSTREMAATLGRGISAVRSAAQSLGLCKKQSGAWSEQELDILRKYYGDGRSLDDMQTLLAGRGKSAIEAMASQIGVTRVRSWHADEERILREFYPTLGTKVAKKLPLRSREAVKIRASELGLKYHKVKPREAPPLRWSDAEWRLLDKHLAWPYDELRALFPGRTKLALEKAKERLRARKKYGK
ncbi:hypothetical protein, partial [Serratia sp. DD3]|uniref:hypothetical protein n=1 Tax=Serratia sp. DD3 TaxID=1410619 RepID=UPI001F1BE46C